MITKEEMLENSFLDRKTALKENLPRYFTGTPCKHGHISERFTSTRTCIACNAVYQATKNLDAVDRPRRTGLVKLIKLDAEEVGENVYNTGKACIRGHMADRYVSSGICVDCSKHYSKVHNKRRSNIIKRSYILCVETNTKYGTIKEAAASCGVSTYSVQSSIAEKRSAKGYTFKRGIYATERLPE